MDYPLLHSSPVKFGSFPTSMFLIPKSKTLFESAVCDRLFGPIISDCAGSACSAQQNAYGYFFTTSAFSIIAMPPRSAILPFNVIVLPQYSAN